MFAKVESFFHSIRQRLSRSEWAVRHLELTPSEGTAEEPGLLLLQIDGLARSQLEKAVAKGRMPFLRQLMGREGYTLHSFYPGIPTTTPAVQAELYYGIRSAVPAFSFYDRARKRLGMMFYPEWAKDFEAGLRVHAEGLLQGGSSWSNIYTGGAAQEESHFCAASIGFGDMWRTGKIGNIFIFILLNFPASLRIAGLLVVEIFVALWDVFDGVRHGEKLWLEMGMAFSQVFVGTGLRELVTIGGKVDLARGLPIIHLNFLSYDEHAHRRGPGSHFARWSLGDIDRAIKELFGAAQRSRRRDYAVWVFSDHGQEQARSFALEVPGGIERVVHDCLEPSPETKAPGPVRSQRRPSPAWVSRGPGAEARRHRRVAADTLTAQEKTTFTVAAMGPVGHVYLAQPMAYEQRLAVAHRLVTQGQVPSVLVCDGPQTKTWVHRRGDIPVPGGVSDLLPHAASLRPELAKDLAHFCENPNVGDLILLGWSPWTRPWTFAPERGAHGGIGPEETRGFALLPARTRLPAGSEAFIRPSALRAAALHRLGRASLDTPSSTKEAGHFRLVTYNTHSCGGTDGRISPRRIARILLEQAADIVALQELDLGRRRSRAEDQAAVIGQALGMHVVFCPTVTQGGEHYGHALLSHWPIQIVKRAFLPADPRSWWKEPRSALWARVQVGSRSIHLLTTHLGLGVKERWLQVQALLGPEWIGGISPGEPIVLCGDLNMMPGSRPYQLLASRLTDIQTPKAGHHPVNTFTSLRPFTRLDHIFVSAELAAARVIVPRNHLTRLASDHLPLVSDLQLQPASVERPTHSSG